MKLDEVNELFYAELDAAKTRLEEVGLIALPSLEVEKNELEGGGIEIISVLATLAVSAEGLSEEDTLYICMSEEPTEYDFDSESCEESVREFRNHVDLLIELAEASEDKAEALRKVCRRIDREIEEKYQAEIDKTNEAVKKNLRTAIIATVALLAVAALCILLKVVMSA